MQETLGLSSITIAADTYTSVLPELARRSGRTSPRRSESVTNGWKRCLPVASIREPVVGLCCHLDVPLGGFRDSLIELLLD